MIPTKNSRGFYWLILGLLIAMPATSCPQVAGATHSTSYASLLSPRAVAHFEAAEAAQDQKNYLLAEREYRAVIAAAPRFAPAYLNLGLVYQSEERRNEGARILKKAVRLDTHLAGAQFFLGLDECIAGNSHAAIPHLAAALRLKPNLQDGYSWLATAQKMNGDLNAEVKTLHRGLRHNPENIDMLYLLGRAYEALGRDAIDHLEKSSPHSSYVEQWLGEDYAQSGYPSAALIHLENAIAASPNRNGLHLEVGEIYLHAGNLERALAEFNAELQRHSHSLRARVRQGEVELLDGNLNRGLRDWAGALAQDPARVRRILELQGTGLERSQENRLPSSLMARLGAAKTRLQVLTGPASQLARAFIAAQQGHPLLVVARDARSPNSTDKEVGSCTASALIDWLRQHSLSAVNACREAAVRLQLTPAIRMEVARALFIEGNPNQALKMLKFTPTATQTLPGVFYWRARCYKVLAVQAYSLLFDAAPDSDRAQQLLGNIYLARHQDTRAIAEYRKALDQDPTLPNLHYEIGHLLWKNFKVSEAREQLKMELALNPRHVGALIDMGTTYLYEHQPEKALDYLTRAENLDPGNSDAHEFLGMAYLRLGMYARAQAELTKAAPSDKDGRVHYQLGKVYQALGEKKEANKEFAITATLNLESHHKNEERVNRLNDASASLKEP